MPPLRDMPPMTPPLRHSLRAAGPALQSLSGLIVLVLAWDLAIRSHPTSLLPGPWAVAKALWDLGVSGLLANHVVASLFRVTWGYVAAVLVAIPFGLWLGMVKIGEQALAPLLEILRPISPLAWIPISILWFGVGDLGAVFIIFLASSLPLALAARNGVAAIPEVHLQAGRNFGLRGFELVRQVIFPAMLPRLLVSLRLTLGIAWLVVVAAEMIAVTSGLGFLIVDARNAGNRYDQVVAGMVMIGLIGIGLDFLLRRFERMPELRWCYAAQ